MVPICRAKGCMVHRVPGPKRDACVKACVLGQEDRRPPAEPPPVEPPPAKPPPVEPPPKAAPMEPPPKAVPFKQRPAEHKRVGDAPVHLWTGKRESKLPNWRSHPLGKPPWDRAACGVLGHGMSRDIEQVSCKACLRTQMAKGRT
jgi:hypothetical protein